MLPNYSLLWAQKSGYKVYDIADGLPGQQITCLYEDSRGVLWIGTKLGMSTFDGYTFRTFTADDGLLSNFIYGFIEYNEGEVYVVSNQGINLFKNGQATQAWKSPKPIVAYALHDKEEKYIYLNNESKEGLLMAFSIERKEFVSLPISPLPENSPALSYLRISVIAYFVKHLPNHTGATKWVLQAPDSLFFTERYRKDNYFVKDPQRFLIPFQSFKELSVLNTLPRRFGYGEAEHTIFGNREVLIHHDHLQKTERRYKLPLHLKWDIVDMLCDRSGNLWLGTESGLVKLYKEGIEYYDVVDGVPGPVWTIQELRGGGEPTYITGSYQPGEAFHLLNQNEFTPLPQNPKGLLSYYAASITAKNEIVLTSSNGAFLYGSERQLRPLNDTLPRIYDQDKKSIRAYLISHTDTLLDEIALGGVDKFLVYDRNRNLKAQLTYEDFLLEDGKTQKSANVVAIEKIDAETYFLGLNNGYLIFNLPEQKIVKRYVYQDALQSEQNLMIRTASRDPQGNLWCGTLQSKGNGLYLYSPKSGTFKQVAAEVLSEPTIAVKVLSGGRYLAACDPDKLLLIHLPRYYEGKKNCFFVLDKHNGFAAKEPMQNGLMQDSRGRLWIPDRADKIFNFLIEESWFDLPKIRINSLRLIVFDQTQKEWRSSGQAIEADSTLRLAQGIRSLRLQFDTDTWQSPEHLRYLFRIRPKNGTWSNWKPTERDVSLLETAPGWYEIELKAYYYFDTETKQPKPSFRLWLYVPPYWYELLWVQVLLGAAAFSVLGAAVYFFVQDRLSKKRLLVQKIQVEAKNKELEDKNKDIEVFNEELTQQNEVLEHQRNEIKRLKEDLEHDFSNDMTHIGEIANFDLVRLKEKSGQQRFSELKKRMRAIHDYYNLLIMGSDYLSLPDLAKKTFEIREGQYSNFGQKVQFSLESDNKEGLRAFQKKRRMFYNLIGELFRNAFKHAFPEGRGAGDTPAQVHLKLSVPEDNCLLIAYRDNGIGLSPGSKKSAGYYSLKDHSEPDAFRWENLPEGGAFIQLKIRIKTPQLLIN